MQTFNLKFTWQLDTKGAVRYGEVLPTGKVAIAPNDPGAIVGTLYIRKSALGDLAIPRELTVTINIADDQAQKKGAA